MIAQTIGFLAFAAVVVAASPPESTWIPAEITPDTDPNSLSCDPAGLITLHLPHYEDCSKFYMCDNGREVEFSCAPGGLVFDFYEQVCNWAWATPCVLRTRDEDLEEGSGDDDYLIGSAPLINESANDDAKHFVNILNCNRADEASKLVPYKNDCQRYWKCTNGVPQSFYCSDGLYFNESSQQCDFEANAKCNIQPVDELKEEFIVYKN